MAPKKGKSKDPPPAKLAAKMAMGPMPKSKKPPPPPACFGPEDLAKFKEIFKAFDEENIDKVQPKVLYDTFLYDTLLNPKTAEIKELFRLFLEDDLVDTVEYHEWLFMIEAKINWGDDFEIAVTKAFAALAHDDEEVGIADLELLREELSNWGELFSEIEFVDWLKFSIKDKTYNPESGSFAYVKFIENMNAKDKRYIKEPINFFKLDQKTLAEMALKKAQEEREEQERKEADRRAKEEAKRQKMIADGVIPPD